MTDTSAPTTYREPLKKIQWDNLSFFIFTGAVGLIGTPLYIHAHGLQTVDIVLTFFYMIATGLAITMGYHRLFAHVAYKAHPIVQFAYLFFGAAAFEQSALKWASQHRDHHLYTDTERDPYNIRQGFWYAHIGWMTLVEHVLDLSNVHDLEKNKMAQHQHKYYVLWAITAGVLVPCLIGALFGRLGAAFIIAVCFRITFVYHATFCINSVCHAFGNSTYEFGSSAKDHWLVALITYGEGYHNFHHRFPSDYRNGIRWYHWDPSKWGIYFLSLLKLADNLKTVSKYKILHARIVAAKRKAHADLEGNSNRSVLQKSLERHYKALTRTLTSLEASAEHYRKIISEDLKTAPERIKTLKENASRSLEKQRSLFKRSYQRWLFLIRKRIPL